MGNSIEEDIELLQDETSSLGLFFKCKGSEEYKIALEHILSDYKRVLKENEELKEIYRSEKKMKNEYVKLYQDLLLKENVIPIQKIKDKIEKILNNKEYRIVFEGNAEFPDDATIINAQKYIKLEKMQELIEESEEK